MKIFFKIILLLIYLLFLLGLVFHTSSETDLLGKYSWKHIILILVFLGLLLPYIKIVNLLLQDSWIELGENKKIKITPFYKLLFYSLLLFICFLPFEIFLRVNYAKNISPEKSIHGFDPYLQNRLVAEDKELHINSHGFRGAEITEYKPQGVYRIFVVGGSTVLSRRVTFEQSHVQRLSVKLQEFYPEIKFEVLNAGNDWHTSKHSLMKYLFKIRKYKPDLIILWHGINDLYRSFSPERFSFGKFQPDYSHYLGPVANMAFDYFKRAHHPGPLFSFNPLSLNLVYNYFKHFLYTDFFEKPMGTMEIYEFPSIAAFSENITMFAERMNIDGVQLMLATQPFLYRDNLSEKELNSLWFAKEVCLEGNKYPDVKSMERGMILFNEKVHQIAELNNLPLIDLESEIPKTGEYFLDDCHYTIEGNELVAQTIFTFIKINQIIKVPAQ